MQEFTVLAVNPGSTSSKIAVFREQEPLLVENVSHNGQSVDLRDFEDQVETRKGWILKALEKNNISLSDIDAFVGRGGGMRPCLSGTYEIIPKLLEDVKANPLIHPAKFAPRIAYELAQSRGKKAYAVNSAHTDEFEPVSRISGIAGIERTSIVHTLNQKEVAIRAARELGKKYQEANFVVAHLGGGISVAAHKKGRMIDGTNTMTGDGPMSPNRCGQMDALAMIDLCFSGKYSEKEMRELVMTRGGFTSLLGTADGKLIEEKIKEGDAYVTLVFDAMCHQIAKAIGSMAAVLEGDVQGVILTGGTVRNPYAVEAVTRKVKFIAPVFVYPGEFEMEALVNGVLRVLHGEEQSLVYTGIPIWGGLPPRKPLQ
jgi:butyrate kinase